MKKRKLTQQQKRRIKDIQQRLLQKSTISTKKTPSTQNTAHTHNESVQKGIVIARYGAHADVSPLEESQAPYRCYIKKNTETLVVGDYVAWHSHAQQDGVIIARYPRTNELYRCNKQGKQRTIAANIDRLFVIIASEPQPIRYQIDRYIVAALSMNIKPIIVLNKKDLLIHQRQEDKIKVLQFYASLGYDTMLTSSNDPESISQLSQILKEHTSIFVGQSGTGKSSLTKKLNPSASIKIDQLSAMGTGRHTTTTARLFHLSGGGKLIDAPGTNEFNLSDMTQEHIARGFVEFQPFMGLCQFKNCTHLHELGCALLDAQRTEQITPERLQSFQLLMVHFQNKKMN